MITSSFLVTWCRRSVVLNKVTGFEGLFRSCIGGVPETYRPMFRSFRLQFLVTSGYVSKSTFGCRCHSCEGKVPSEKFRASEVSPYNGLVACVCACVFFK